MAGRLSLWQHHKVGSSAGSQQCVQVGNSRPRVEPVDAQRVERAIGWAPRQAIERGSSSLSLVAWARQRPRDPGLTTSAAAGGGARRKRSGRVAGVNNQLRARIAAWLIIGWSNQTRLRTMRGNLLEWNYGNYDGRTSVDIHAERPDWLLFRDGYPGRNASRRGRGAGPIAMLPCPGLTRDVLVFSSGISLPCATHF